MSNKSKNNYTDDRDFDELLDKVFRIMKTKAVDYAKEGDRLAQFRSASEKYGVSMRQVLGVYMDKHMESINKWICGEELKGEPIEDKLLDNIVYSLLGYKIAKEERRKNSGLIEIEDPSLIERKFQELVIEADIANGAKEIDTVLKQTCLLKCDSCQAIIAMTYPETSKLPFEQWKETFNDTVLDCSGCIDVRMIDAVKSAEGQAKLDIKY